MATTMREARERRHEARAIRRIKQAKALRNWTDKDIADRCDNLNDSQINDRLRGAASLKFEEAFEIAEALGMPDDLLLEEDDAAFLQRLGDEGFSLSRWITISADQAA